MRLVAISVLNVFLSAFGAVSIAVGSSPQPVQQRMVEWTIESRKVYADPFNDVDVDVVFSKDGQSWRVPAFWRGGQRWTVRFAPPASGTYRFRVSSTDETNHELNRRKGAIKVRPFSGSNELLRHGRVRISANKRYFEWPDGTPFYWLGDIWWTGLSDRLSWEGFQTLTADRKRKGFTVIQIVGGLVPYEEKAPSDPGFCNEGGCVWEPDFARINPQYFDYADRRIQHLIENGLVPAIVGGWRDVLSEMGIEKMKQHWRYLIARYGAYPVFWIGGGELFDPPAEVERKWGATVPFKALKSPGWTEVVRYIRDTDPYRHPLTAHEIPPPLDTAIKDESLTDFDLFQAGRPTAIAVLNKHYARITVTKPILIGELGCEDFGGAYLADVQRSTFWLAMLNGAAGHTYCAAATWESYSTEKPFHREKLTYLTWDEGMKLPGSYQVGLGASLLRKYRWWEFKPHPEWVTPAGTTLLKPTSETNVFNLDTLVARSGDHPPPEEALPLGEWQEAGGNWRLPYATGIAGEVRIIYLPYFGLKPHPVPTVRGLEPHVRYRAFYWEPSLGIRFDLGGVESASAGIMRKVDTSALERKLYDAEGRYRGELSGPGWEDYGSNQKIEGDAYTPEAPPGRGDWVLILEAHK